MSEQGQTRSHGQGKTGRMSRLTETEVDKKLTAHTLENAARDLASIPHGLSRFEWERMRDDLVSRIELAARTLASVERRER